MIRMPYRRSRLIGSAALVGALMAGVTSQGSAQQAVASPHGALPEGLDCSQCHTAQGWQVLREPLAFHHGDRSGFLVSGAHERAKCTSCHLDLRFDGPAVAMSDCASCHADVHEGRMVQECVACHTTTSFRDVNGELVHARTSFPLTGAHRQVTCESCHRDDQGGAFTPLDTDCASCHLPAYDAAQAVDHLASGYPTDCTQCHSTLAWADTPAFDHVSVSGGFELLGAHDQLRCASCHVQPGMAVLHPAADQNDCVACHQADYDRRHGGGGFPTTCLTCHTMDSWDEADFDHALTGFPLVEPHSGLDCSRCHTDGQEGLKFPVPSGQTDCAACHQADYDKEHGGSGYPTTCVSCHKSNSWDGASFNHGATAFPLVGAHTSATCADCHGPPAHLSALFQGAESCVACHQGDYDQAHQGSGFPSTCLLCHNQAKWDGASVDHAQISNGFALDGPHAAAACETCHTLPDYGLKFPIPTGQEDCVACHQTEYDANHAGSNFPTTCLSCHAADSWDGAHFDHGASTGFALDGPHAAATCETCHTVPDYGLKFPKPAGQSDCVVCHQTEYDANHAGSNFPTTCLSCHKANTWDGAVFDHGVNTGFALVQSHAAAPCTSCHTLPDYGLKFAKPANQSDCATCHQTEYDANHAGSNFPLSCLNCHNQTTWSGAVFDHGSATGFGLEGPHTPLECTACHAVPTYTLLFPKPSNTSDCVACHQGDYDANHGGSTFPTTCLTCHVANTWSGATVDHVTIGNGFALLGAHAVTSCAACHAIPGYALVFPKPSNPSDCVACHQVDYVSAHGASGYPTDCSACHTVNAWKPSTFNHDSQYFPIYSGKHRNEWTTCTQCHTSPSNLAVFSCLTCHEHSQTKMDDKHKGRQGYSYTSAACLSCHPTGKAD